MSQALKYLAIALLCFFLGIGSVFVWLQYSNSTQESEVGRPTPPAVVQNSPVLESFVTMTPTPAAQTPSPAPVVATGSITGSLGYPSSFIPPLEIFVVTTDLKVATTQLTMQNQATFTIKDLAPNTYYLYAYPQDSDELSGGYTNAVPCGLSVECTDHALRPVVVEPGKTTSGVEIKDWYAPAGTFPKKQ